MVFSMKKCRMILCKGILVVKIEYIFVYVKIVN